MHCPFAPRLLMLPTTSSLQRLMFVSDLAPAMPSGVVGQILRQSRERIHQRQFTGALLFDGERFCQLLEGEATAARALMAKLERDPRHCRLKLLLHTTANPPGLMTLWQCGYCEHGSFDAIEAAAAIEPDTAVRAFRRLLEQSDVLI